jgi:hypothetical protein
MRASRKILTQEEWDALMRTSAGLGIPESRSGRLRSALAKLLNKLVKRVAAERR